LRKQPLKNQFGNGVKGRGKGGTKGKGERGWKRMKKNRQLGASKEGDEKGSGPTKKTRVGKGEGPLKRRVGLNVRADFKKLPDSQLFGKEKEGQRE